MQSSLEGGYYAASVLIRLNTPALCVCFIGSPEITSSPEISRLSYPEVKTEVVQDADALAECIAWLRNSKAVHLKEVFLSSPAGASSYLAYLDRSSSVADSATQEVRIMTASDFAVSKDRIYHVNLSSLDIAAEKLAESPAARHLRSLDLSRLQLEDENVIALTRSGHFPYLRWLDLSGNPGITYAAVEAIAMSVKSQNLSHLEWLDLLGTDFDATPYIDGCYWRMTDAAKQLAAVHGYQSWMMLGSKIPEMANKELLTLNQRRTPPDRFSLP